MLVKVIYSFIVLFTLKDLYIFVMGRSLGCTKSSEKIADDMFGHMIGYGNNSRKFPINNNELTTYCRYDNVVLDFFNV